jgi:hypothetical protein
MQRLQTPEINNPQITALVPPDGRAMESEHDNAAQLFRIAKAIPNIDLGSSNFFSKHLFPFIQNNCSIFEKDKGHDYRRE